MAEDSEQLQQKVDALEREVAALKYGSGRCGVRKRSRNYVWGLPLYDIAIGPDADKSEVRGHARGIVAVGDIATGIVAVGGFARHYRARRPGPGHYFTRRLLNRGAPWYRWPSDRCDCPRWRRNRRSRCWWRCLRVLRMWRRRFWKIRDQRNGKRSRSEPLFRTMASWNRPIGSPTETLNGAVTSRWTRAADPVGIQRIADWRPPGQLGRYPA